MHQLVGSYRLTTMQGKTYKMVHHGDEQVKEERRAAGVHFHLHGTATLEGVAAADDESEVMST